MALLTGSGNAMPRSTQRSDRPRLARLRRNELLVALAFISPWIVGFCWFQLYPIFASIRYSFTSYNMMQPPVWIGLSNYETLFTGDPLFRKALLNTAIYTLFSVPLDLFVAFCFALLLNMQIPGRAFFRTAFYFPAIIPSVATAILWTMLLNAQGGLLNVALGYIGIGPIAWLTSPSWTMPSLILLSVWGIGPTVVIFLAGLQDVPRDLYEAAQLDGAGPLRLVRDVTIPMISPVILFNLVIGMIAALQVFAQPFIIFGQSTTGVGGNGGPLNSVLMYSVQLYNVAFVQFQMGYAAAMAWILFVIIFALSLLSMRLLTRYVHYE
ncbi:MAG TPA: sugar ABC transporter permease [Thermomicrobiales bacterium]|nr:sugar ABC transporter permease [Thermomicrobiales bacterium]